MTATEGGVVPKDDPPATLRESDGGLFGWRKFLR